MGTTSAERMKLHRDRKRLGLRPVQVLVSEQDIDYLLAKDYELTRTDDRSIGSAVSAFLSDSFWRGLITFHNTSDVAACRSNASSSSRVSRATSFSSRAADALGSLRRFALVAGVRGFADLPLAVGRLRIALPIAHGHHRSRSKRNAGSGFCMFTERTVTPPTPPAAPSPPSDRACRSLQ
jgi:hypothetical protein